MKSSIQIAAALFAFACASGAEVYVANINTLDLDRDPLVVTNVSFMGLATEVGVESSVRNATADVMVAVSGKQDELPYPTNAIPYLALTNIPDLSVYAEKDDLALKQDRLPYDTNSIPYSAIEGAPDMSLKQDALPYPTNAIPYSSVVDTPDLSVYATVEEVGKKQETLPYPTNEIPYSAISGKPDMSLKQDALPYPTNEIPYSSISGVPDVDFTKATNAANFAISELVRTNTVLNGGPYLKEHQSLETSTNYTDYAVAELAKTNSVLSNGPYLKEHQSLEPSTNYTDYAVIELARTNSVLANGPYVQSASMTNTVRDIVTNTVTIGYTDWVYSGNTIAGVTYTINVTESGSDYVFTLYNPSEIGSVTTNVLHPTRLDFTGVGIVAECTPIIRNVNGLAMYSDVQALETKIDTMDTSYYRVVGITNKNQSVQFVETDANTTSLQILMPESGMTKDWLVYVKALTNLTLVLPPADYWVVNESVTNEIPPLVPTALYFSQISDNTYSIGRQELMPITVLSQREIENQMIRAKMRKAGLASRNAKRSVTTSNGTAK